MPERVAGSRSREDLFDLGWRFLGITWNWALLLFAGLIVVEWVIRKRKRLL
jgi:ABC-type multidrug transport system permease subunit